MQVRKNVLTLSIVAVLGMSAPPMHKMPPNPPLRKPPIWTRWLSPASVVRKKNHWT